MMTEKPWGKPYSLPYKTDAGQIARMHRKGRAVRWYTQDGQVGPEQKNVAPALAYAIYHGWRETE